VTVTDLIKASLRLLRVYGPNETPTSTEQSDGLVILNEMLDSFNAERLFVYQIARSTHTLTANQSLYTIGTGGSFNTARPARIESAGLILDSSLGTAQQVEVPIEVLLYQDEWASIYLKGLTSTYPRKMWYNPVYPLGEINLWPVPTGTTQKLVLYAWGLLTAFATVGDTVALPPGYGTLLRTNLAVWLAEEYGVTPTENVIDQARNSKARVKDLNLSRSVPLLTCDYPSRDRGRFNILLGDWKQ
jgi:hypothetical protein